jgi:hypothetical protein
MTQEFLDALKLNGMVAASLRAGVEKGEGGE